MLRGSTFWANHEKEEKAILCGSVYYSGENMNEVVHDDFFLFLDLWTESICCLIFWVFLDFLSV